MPVQRKTKKKIRYVKLHTNVKKGLYEKVPFSDGEELIPVTIKMTKPSLADCNRGQPFECVISKGVMTFADANPEAFPHPVLYVYTTKTATYIVDDIKNGKMSHARRYMHGFSKFVDTFDKITPEKFAARYDGVGLNLNLRPGRKYRKGESTEGGNGSGGSRSHKMARGAMERAIAAGIIPNVGDNSVESVH